MPNPLFTANVVLREIIARQRRTPIPFTPIQAFGLPLYDVPASPVLSDPATPPET